ncbi:MAG: Sapep family Mn(2+)-dependent dipeptidase, partial [Oscillospiraceae bacterium]|nr:Sapep family Mn(2+)-dependent dipeptidase [Oscillospiraceae bacterium]
MNAYETHLMERVDRWVNAHAQAMAQDVMELVRYRSVSEKNADVKPYGRACRDVVDRAAAMCAGYGFNVRNHDYRSCTALLKGNTDEQIGIFGHLDVVPEGNDWTFPPFEPFVRDGYIAGRGTSDNKGPAVAALYAMRCLRELNVALNHSVLLFLGAAEEVGMDDVVHYIENNKAPKFSFTPDSMYSVCYGEKGVLNARFARDVAGGNLVAFNGGHVTNSVADRAVAVISGFSLTDVQKAVAGYGDITAREAEDNNGGTKGLGRCVELTAVGVARHAAFPEGSVNAIQRLALALSEQGLVTGAALGAMQFIAGALADNWGT